MRETDGVEAEMSTKTGTSKSGVKDTTMWLTFLTPVVEVLLSTLPCPPSLLAGTAGQGTPSPSPALGRSLRLADLFNTA